LASSRANWPSFHSTAWKGPDPITGSFLKLLVSSEGTFSQMCLGRMYTYIESICTEGSLVLNTTVFSSGVSMLSICLT
jgi:hypothetical protein